MVMGFTSLLIKCPMTSLKFKKEHFAGPPNAYDAVACDCQHDFKPKVLRPNRVCYRPLRILVLFLSQVGRRASDRTRHPNYPWPGSTLHVTGWLPTMHSEHETLKPGFCEA